MKKIACILVALVCALGFAFADGDLSPDGGKFFGSSHIIASNVDDVEALGLLVRPVNELYAELSEEELERRINEVNIELAKMLAADSITDYFGDVYVSSTGEQVPLIDLFDGQQPDVFEVDPMIVSGYDLSFGDVTVDMMFPTPYELGEQVAVLIGVIAVDGEGDQRVTWVAHKGEDVEIVENGETVDAIEVTFRDVMMDTMQNRDAIVAIASEHHDEVQE